MSAIEQTRRRAASRRRPGPHAGRRPGRHPGRKPRGLSIIELMVGLVVAMLVSLAAAGSAIMFTASQRQSMGVGGSGISAATALAALKNDAALAGLGFFGDSRYLCEKLALSDGAAVPVDAASFTPLRITAGVDDTVEVLYGNRIESGANVLLASSSDGSAAELESLLPVVVGQTVMLAPKDPGDPCLVRSVTAVTASTETTPQTLSFGNTGRHNQMAFSVAPAFDVRDRIALIGDLAWNRYRRDGNNLVLERPLAGGDPVVLTRNVIALRAQYGVAAAAAGSTTLENWVNATGGFAALDAATLPRVRALRMGVVTRSPQREKPNAAGDCEASLAKPQLFGQEIEPDVADWQCWRYRVATVVVPMRNLVLGLKE